MALLARCVVQEATGGSRSCPGRQDVQVPVHCGEPNHGASAPAPVESAGLSLGQGIKVMLFRWERWQWGIFKAV